MVDREKCFRRGFANRRPGCGRLRVSQEENQTDILKRYLCRFLKLWIIWCWFLALDGLGLVIDTFVPAFSPPRWLYWAIAAFGFLAANVKLFAEQESEKQKLQGRINEFEDTRADIHFKKKEDFCYPASIHYSCFVSGKKGYHDSEVLYRDGLPIGVIIGAHLEGWKWSDEPGKPISKIAEVDLPPLFDLLNEGSFQNPKGVTLDRIEGFSYGLPARYELPIKITVEDPRSFAQRLNSVDSYRVVIQYYTKRVDDSESTSHLLTLEGDFQEFRDEICEKWKGWGFSELAQLAECQ